MLCKLLCRLPSGMLCKLLLCKLLMAVGCVSSRERLPMPEKLGLASRLLLEGPRTNRLLREPLLTRRCRLVQLAVLDLQAEQAC